MGDTNNPSMSSGTGDETIDVFRLPTIFHADHVEHHITFSDRRRNIRRGTKLKRWKTKHEIGRGGFGIVYLQEEEKSQKLRAVKQLLRPASQENSLNPLRELTAMATLSKELTNFVEFKGWYQNDTHLYIAMEYFEFGDLGQCVTAPLPEVESQRILFQVAEALEFMHEKHFTHRDLKPSNIFVVHRGPENWWVKVADFGVSKQVLGNQNTSLHTSLTGDFMAPEILGFTEDSCEYTNAVDMWSLGCLASWLLTQQVLVDVSKMYLFSRGRFPLPLDVLSSKAVSKPGLDFVANLLVYQPHLRMSALAAVRHEWLRSHSSNDGLIDDTSSAASRDSLDLGKVLPTRSGPLIKDEPPAKEKLEGRPPGAQEPGPKKTQPTEAKAKDISSESSTNKPDAISPLLFTPEPTGARLGKPKKPNFISGADLINDEVRPSALLSEKALLGASKEASKEVSKDISTNHALHKHKESGSPSVKNALSRPSTTFYATRTTPASHQESSPIATVEKPNVLGDARKHIPSSPEFSSLQRLQEAAKNLSDTFSKPAQNPGEPTGGLSLQKQMEPKQSGYQRAITDVGRKSGEYGFATITVDSAPKSFNVDDLLDFSNDSNHKLDFSNHTFLPSIDRTGGPKPISSTTTVSASDSLEMKRQHLQGAMDSTVINGGQSFKAHAGRQAPVTANLPEAVEEDQLPAMTERTIYDVPGSFPTIEPTLARAVAGAHQREESTAIDPPKTQSMIDSTAPPRETKRHLQYNEALLNPKHRAEVRNKAASRWVSFEKYMLYHYEKDFGRPAFRENTPPSHNKTSEIDSRGNPLPRKEQLFYSPVTVNKPEERPAAAILEAQRSQANRKPGLANSLFPPRSAGKTVSREKIRAKAASRNISYERYMLYHFENDFGRDTRVI